MSNKSTKSGSTSKRQKGIGSPNPDIKIVDTSHTSTSRGTSLVGEPLEDANVKYTNEPLRMRLEYK